MMALLRGQKHPVQRDHPRYLTGHGGLSRGPLSCRAMKLPGSGELDPELDARLVARCIDGDARSWEALVRRHERLVYSIGRSYRLGDEDMGDVFQEVFTALLKGMPPLREGAPLGGGRAGTTERIARTTALNRRRGAAREDREEETSPPLAASRRRLSAVV